MTFCCTTPILCPWAKTEVQHLEITRDIAAAFNHQYGDTFVVPQAKVEESVMTVPGTDGRKMSKSYGNTITLFQSDKDLKKEYHGHRYGCHAARSAQNPDTCNACLRCTACLAEPAQVEEMRQKSTWAAITATATPKPSCLNWW